MSDHICRDCGKTFRFPNGLTRHRRQQHNDDATCIVDGCTARAVGRSLCKLHYERTNAGLPLELPVGIRTRRDVAERFWDKVAITYDGCWTWTAYKNAGGYGAFRMPGRNSKVVSAHRFSYELLVGPIPQGLTIDHLCRNRGCVNPDHLEAVTQGENYRRSDARSAVAMRLQRCARGHEYSPENTYTRTNGRYHDCRVCRRMRAAARRASGQ